MTKRKSFVIHIDSLDILDDLTDEQAGQLFKAIKSHHLDEELMLSALVKIAFSPFKNQFARDDEKYQKIVERNKTNGLKGGRPKTQGNPKEPSGFTGNPNNPSEPDNGSDSGSGSKSDSGNGNKDLLSGEKIPDAEIVINYFNETCKTKYKKTTKSHIENINGRLSDGHSVEDLKKVIDFKYAEWKDQPSMAQYIRPQTLFNAGKFQGYLTASNTTKSPANNTYQRNGLNKIDRIDTEL